MSKFTPQEFVKVWMDKCEDASLNDIGEVFGVSRQYVEQYSQNLRKKGVNLPKLSRSPRILKEVNPQVVDELNLIIQATPKKAKS